MADASGEVVNTRGYEPFGSVLASAGTNGSQFGFAGEQNAAAGMQYLRARYYAPGMGRFMSRDVWGGDSNIPMSFNRWNYVEGNPVNWTDPSGYHKGIDSVKDNIQNFKMNEAFIRQYGLEPIVVAAAISVQWEYNKDSALEEKQTREYFKDTTRSSDGIGPAQTNAYQQLTYITELLKYHMEVDDCTLAQLGSQFAGYYYGTFDPTNWNDAIKAMTIKIFHSTSTCEGCSEFDKLVIAAMAQNTAISFRYSKSDEQNNPNITAGENEGVDIQCISYSK